MNTRLIVHLDVGVARIFRRLESPGVNFAGEFTPTKWRRIGSPVGPRKGKATDTAYLCLLCRRDCSAICHIPAYTPQFFDDSQGPDGLEKVRKERTYAQIITFCPERPVQFDIKLLDWPTLKEGLKNLIQTCGANTNWSTRYLTDA